MQTLLRSETTQVKITTDGPAVVIGEKINPTGRKKLAAALEQGNLDYVVELAQAQVAWGADVLDVNVGVPGLDDVKMLPQVVKLVASVVTVPICIDTPNTDALAAALCRSRPASRWSTRSTARRSRSQPCCRSSRIAARQ